jgi:D-3-phosphoglycerate dehydrogenase / 2-oxoglutarate reductase
VPSFWFEECESPVNAPDRVDPGPVGRDAHPVVLVTTRSFSSGAYDALGALAAAGCVVRRHADHELDAISVELAVVSGWIAGTAPVTAEHLDRAPHLRILARYGTGVDAVDLEAAARRGVVVTNTPDANTDAVAELAVALILAALRGLTAADRRMRRGDWSVKRGRELGNCTVGIVGLGRIGRGVAKRLAPFGGRLIGHDPWLSEQEARATGVEPVALEALAAQADIVTLHAPGGSTIVDAAWLVSSKPGQIMVNTARASLVDEPAVAAALRDGRLGRYASDTLSAESGATSPLLDPALEPVTIFSPHAGAHTREAVDRMGRGAVEAVLALLGGGTPGNVVNIPAAR